jgi:hypothetical protein
MDKMKYSIFMPYIFRAPQLWNTLISFLHHYSDRDDYEVILVEDVKNKRIEGEHELLLEVVKYFEPKLNLRFFETDWPRVTNPAPFYNFCAEKAQGEYFVITNPECFHYTNILAGFDEEFAKDKYVYLLASCVDREVRNDKSAYTSPEEEQWICNFHDFKFESKRSRNSALYHFCSAMYYTTWDLVGGFCNEYAEGVAAEDDDFRDQIHFMEVEFVLCEDLIVVHQAHNRGVRKKGWGSKNSNIRIYNERRKKRLDIIKERGGYGKIKPRVRQIST